MDLPFCECFLCTNNYTATCGPLSIASQSEGHHASWIMQQTWTVLPHGGLIYLGMWFRTHRCFQTSAHEVLALLCRIVLLQQPKRLAKVGGVEWRERWWLVWSM